MEMMILDAPLGYGSFCFGGRGHLGFVVVRFFVYKFSLRFMEVLGRGPGFASGVSALGGGRFVGRSSRNPKRPPALPRPPFEA